MNTLMDLRAGLVGGITVVIQSRVGKWTPEKTTCNNMHE